MTKYVSQEFMNQLGKYVPRPALSGAGFESVDNSNQCGDVTWSITVGDTCNGWKWVAGTYNDESLSFIAKQFIPTKIIYNCPATICYFPDGTKTVVKVAEDEEYIKEEGVMACIMKKLFKSRNQFKKLVEAGYENIEAGINRGEHNAFLFESRDI